MNERYLEAFTKIKNEISSVKSDVESLEKNFQDYKNENTNLKTLELARRLDRYHIVDGKWYYDEFDTGVSAVGPEGKQGPKGDSLTFDDLTPDEIMLLRGTDGLDGVDGKDGKDGKPGKDGKDGRDGRDGIDGKDGKDGETPELEIGEIKSVSTYDPAKVTLKKNKNKYVIDMDIPRGRPGANGSDGSNGSPAKINGEETLNIVAGTNIILNQSGDTLTISARGGGSGGSATDVRINGTSITDENDIANIITEGTYDADTNPIATMDDLPTVPEDVSAFNNDAGYLTGYTEIDPVFSASVAAGISSSDISNWNGKGTYSKPSGGIPKSDLASAVQTSLGKADTALQTEQYTGTITGITMNGTSKGTSGVVDLGTVLTEHQDISGKLDASKVKNTNSTTAGDVYDVRYINTMLGDIESLLGGI